MSKQSRNDAVMERVLLALLPKMCWSERTERPWHSVTFVGRRISMAIPNRDPMPDSDRAELNAQLSELDFGLTGEFVADIAASQFASNEAGDNFTLEILVLEE